MAVGSPPLQAEAQDGNVTVRLILPSDWSTVTNAVGGGPLLVRNGKPVFHTREEFDAAALAGRDARAAVGQLADGRIVLVAVDGGQPGYSVGVSSFELARAMAGLGAVTAASLASGDAVTAAFDGQVLNRPQAAGGRPVKEALLVRYEGVYAPPPPVTVLGKKDLAAGEQLAYRIVRPSTVTAAVVGPDGTAHTLDSRRPAAGHVPLHVVDHRRRGQRGNGASTAVDDLGRQSQVDQAFTYDLTLSSLAVPRSATAGAGATVRFQLAAPGSVDARRSRRRAERSSPRCPARACRPGRRRSRWDGTPRRARRRRPARTSRA